MGNLTRVLVVDDSALARMVISRRISLDPGIEVVGVAYDGVDALEKVKTLKPDVVTLDVEMPRMDGLTTLSRIMSECPTPVVMLSRLTEEDAEVTIKALEAGAVDFFLKPSMVDKGGLSNAIAGLNDKIKMAGRVDISRVVRTLRRGTSRYRGGEPLLPASTKTGGPRPQKNLVIIGSSTGGPKALCEIVPGLPRDLPASILIVQHMPMGFTRSLARRLAQISQVDVREAVSGDKIRQGQALVAPGNYHMIVAGFEEVGLTQEPPRNGVRPSIDVTMESAAASGAYHCIGVVLTGMGSDGKNGAAAIKKSGGVVIAQDEPTSVIYGMPRSVAECGCADKVLPLHAITQEIIELCRARTANSPWRELDACGT
ncbi:MAG: chemotaxis response regulator protein-glutamate methylesterase [Dehalococcoidia bacterium]|nr:chemotaxis response regulator protein-glutamate methylesterase [Dehalococcoidia bacterium]